MISGLVESFGGASGDVVAGAGVAAHAGEDDAPEGVVGLAVAAGVEAVAGDLAGAVRDRGGAAELGEGALRCGAGRGCRRRR